MKVILLENLKKIGSIGEIIDVRRGFARNFLIANKKALYASKENVSKVEKIKTELSKKDNERKLEAKKIAEKINKKVYGIKKLSTETNELYGCDNCNDPNIPLANKFQQNCSVNGCRIDLVNQNGLGLK